MENTDTTEYYTTMPLVMLNKVEPWLQNKGIKYEVLDECQIAFKWDEGEDIEESCKFGHRTMFTHICAVRCCIPRDKMHRLVEKLRLTKTTDILMVELPE